MEQITVFLSTYGWQLALIALAGVVILGILKYTNAFSKIEKANRKPIYFVISIGFSLIAAVIYLAVLKQLTFGYFTTIAIAIYALNQTFYAIYETTNLKDLLTKLADTIKQKIEEKKNKE